MMFWSVHIKYCSVMNFKKVLFLLLAYFFGSGTVFSQSLEEHRPSVLNTSGGSTLGADGLVYDFSIGELSLVQTFTTPSFTLTQGFLQPFLLPLPDAIDVKVVQNVSPNGDGIGDFLVIENIEKYPKNVFTLFNRYGNEVFSIDNYNNTDRVFKGLANGKNKQFFVDNKPLPDGTYYYILSVDGVAKTRSQSNLKGFIVIKTK